MHVGNHISTGEIVHRMVLNEGKRLPRPLYKSQKTTRSVYGMYVYVCAWYGTVNDIVLGSCCFRAFALSSPYRASANPEDSSMVRIQAMIGCFSCHRSSRVTTT